MLRVPRVQRSLAAFACGLVGLAVAGCSAVTPSGLRVGDTRVSRDSIDADLKGYEKALLASAPTPADRAQLGETLRTKAGFTADFTIAVLNRRVSSIALDKALAASGAKTVTVTKELRTRAEESMGGPKAFAALSKELQDRELRLVSLPTLLAEKKVKTLGTPEAFYKANPTRFTLEACSRHILIPDEKRVTEVRAKIVGGANFAELAKVESTDTGSGSNGGDLGCGDPGQFVPEFANAVRTLKIGELSQPIKTQFGFHLIEVKSRKVAPFAEVKDVIGDDMLAKAREDVEVDVAKFADDLSVDPVYGVVGKDPNGRPAILPTPVATDGAPTTAASGQG